MTLFLGSDAIHMLEMLDNSDIDFCSDDSDDDSDDDGDFEPTCSDTQSADSNDCEELQSPPTKKSKKTSKKVYSFKKSAHFTSKFEQATQPLPTPTDNSAVEELEQYFTDDIFSLIADPTNRYHAQNTGKSLGVTPAEIAVFFGICLLMGCINMKRIKMYWARKTNIPIIANAMRRDRFFKLRSNLKVVDNNLVTAEMKTPKKVVESNTLC